MNESALTDCSTSHTTRDMRVDPYFELSKDIKPQMRNIVLNWLMYVNNILKRTVKTYLLTVNIIDRVTYILNPAKSKYQLLGLAAFSIADMLCETYSMGDADIAHIGKYEVERLVSMRSRILKALNYDILTAVSYDHHQNAITLGIVGEELDLINIFLQLFTTYDIIFILFPREQYLLACGLVMILYDYHLNNTSLETTCRALVQDHIKSVLTGLNKTKQISSRPEYLLKFSLNSIIGKLTTQ